MRLWVLPFLLTPSQNATPSAQLLDAVDQPLLDIAFQDHVSHRQFFMCSKGVLQ